MTISQFFRVSEKVPDKVWQEFGHTQEYDWAIQEATRGNIGAGRNAHGSVEEWAEFCSRKEAEACRHRLMDVMYKFAAKLIGDPE